MAAIIDYETSSRSEDFQWFGLRDALKLRLKMENFRLDGDDTQILIKRMTEAEIPALPFSNCCSGRILVLYG